MNASSIPAAFAFRRIHSLLGLWLVLFLLEHLLTNSQAALLLGDNGRGFVKMVNFLHDLPYLPALELFLIGTPIVFHAVLGIKYLMTAKNNAKKTDGSAPSLREYGRNRAYKWQRITSWILLVGLIGHVAKFRFIEYPVSVNEGISSEYFVRVRMDSGLYTVADRLHVKLYDGEAIEKQKQAFNERKEEASLLELAEDVRGHPSYTFIEGVSPEHYSNQKEILLTSAQKFSMKKKWIEALTARPLSSNEVVAVTKSFGVATMLSVRDTFKSPLYVLLYTVFVLAACFHAFNGLWTFVISWGLVFRQSAQKSMVTFCLTLMAVIAFLGLAAIWGTYWLNLKY
jgi:succinate dehydrogenase / fumarate reductase cytochrome b subunit